MTPIYDFAGALFACKVQPATLFQAVHLTSIVHALYSHMFCVMALLAISIGRVVAHGQLADTECADCKYAAAIS